MNFRLLLLAATLPSTLALGMTQPRAASRGLVYVETNAPDNAVLGFQRDAYGQLTPLAAGPFATGGAGVVDPQLNGGAAFDLDQAVVADPARGLLFAVNGGSDSVSVFQIAGDGSLTLTAGSAFPSFGSQPVSVGLQGDTLVVVNKNAAPGQDHSHSLPSYATFQVGAGGGLTHVDGGNLEATADSSPSQALAAPLGRFVFDADVGAKLLRSFAVGADGRLQLVDVVSLPLTQFPGGTAAVPLGLAAHPSQPLVYVGVPSAAQVAVYRYDQAGKLALVGSAPNSGKAVCWLIVSKDGQRLYTSNSADHSVSVYDLKDPTKPVEIQHLTLDTQGSAFQIAADPDGAFVYVVTQRTKSTLPADAGNELHVLSVDPATGVLREAAGSPTVIDVAEGVRPQGVAAL